MSNLKSRLNRLENQQANCCATITPEEHHTRWQEAFKKCGIENGKPLPYPQIPIVIVGVSPDLAKPDTYSLSSLVE